MHQVPAQAGREADEALQLLPPKSQDKSHTSRHYDFFAKAMATGDDGKPQAGVEGARHPALRDGKRGSGGKTPEERREEYRPLSTQHIPPRATSCGGSRGA